MDKVTDRPFTVTSGVIVVCHISQYQIEDRKDVLNFEYNSFLLFLVHSTEQKKKKVWCWQWVSQGLPYFSRFSFGSLNGPDPPVLPNNVGNKNALSCRPVTERADGRENSMRKLNCQKTDSFGVGLGSSEDGPSHDLYQDDDRSPTEDLRRPYERPFSAPPFKNTK